MQEGPLDYKHVLQFLIVSIDSKGLWQLSKIANNSPPSQKALFSYTKYNQNYGNQGLIHYTKVARILAHLISDRMYTCFKLYDLLTSCFFEIKNSQIIFGSCLSRFSFCTAVFSGKSFSPASTWFDKFFSKSAKNMICLLITHQFCNTFFAAFPSNTFLTNYKNSFSPLEKKPSLARRFCTF